MRSSRQGRVDLSPREAAAWRGLLRVQSTLFKELDADLMAEHGLPLRSYELLMVLRDAPGRRLRMTDVSREVLLSPSGVTRLVDRLVREGLVERTSCENDGRGCYASLTRTGARLLRRADQTHLGGVRRLFLDRLSADDLEQLAACWERLTAERTKAA